MSLDWKLSRRLTNDDKQSPTIAAAPADIPASQETPIRGDRQAGKRTPAAIPRQVLEGPRNRRPSRQARPPSIGAVQRLLRISFSTAGAMFAAVMRTRLLVIAKKANCMVGHYL